MAAGDHDPSLSEDRKTRTADDAKTELQFIGGVFAGLAILAYFAGFLVRYYFLDFLGLSPSSTTLPLYYFGVYGFALAQRAPETLLPIAIVAVIATLICEMLRQAILRRSHAQRSLTVYVAYPVLGVCFISALLVLPNGAQTTARRQLQDLWSPRHTEGVRLVLRPALQVRCEVRVPDADRSDEQRLACASEERRLVLVAESPRDLVFFERRKSSQGGLPVTSIYRLRRSDVVLTTTRTGP